jgi:hypothetical protein
LTSNSRRVATDHPPSTWERNSEIGDIRPNPSYRERGRLTPRAARLAPGERQGERGEDAEVGVGCDPFDTAVDESGLPAGRGGNTAAELSRRHVAARDTRDHLVQRERNQARFEPDQRQLVLGDREVGDPVELRRLRGDLACRRPAIMSAEAARAPPTTPPTSAPADPAILLLAAPLGLTLTPASCGEPSICEASSAIAPSC